MPPPAVSVLISVRNDEAGIRLAAESILQGTLRNLELLLVDDGSTDGTGRALDELAGNRGSGSGPGSRSSEVYRPQGQRAANRLRRPGPNLTVALAQRSLDRTGPGDDRDPAAD